MKNTITIDGITLTRDQVQRAFVGINAAPTVKNLTQVVTRNDRRTRGIVIYGRAQESYARGAALTSGRYLYTVITEGGSGSSYPSEESLLHHWEPVEGARPSQGTSVQDRASLIQGGLNGGPSHGKWLGEVYNPSYGTPAGPTTEYR